jgi:hypothetical protein
VWLVGWLGGLLVAVGCRDPARLAIITSRTPIHYHHIAGRHPNRPTDRPTDRPAPKRMPKQLQTVVRQGRKVLANLWLKEILTTRDACFFFQPPSLDGGTTLEMKQKFHTQLGMTWRHVRPKVSRHYLEGGQGHYRELQRLMQGPVMVAYPEEAKDRAISTKQVNVGWVEGRWLGGWKGGRVSVDRSVGRLSIDGG